MASLEKTVKKALIDNDMTMRMLANRLGISCSYVSDLIKGKRSNSAQLARIFAALNISTDDGMEAVI